VNRVRRLTITRVDALETATAELRRIERDLHDGAQARLVALGISLRATERLIKTNPDAAVALVAETRENSARALAELRALVRGINPPVLAERGLGDANRALALDCPVPATAEVDLPRRLPPPAGACSCSQDDLPWPAPSLNKCRRSPTSPTTARCAMRHWRWPRSGVVRRTPVS
jgi:hypothetical protein